jgi:hypothetical protein
MLKHTFSNKKFSFITKVENLLIKYQQGNTEFNITIYLLDSLGQSILLNFIQINYSEFIP